MLFFILVVLGRPFLPGKAVFELPADQLVDGLWREIDLERFPKAPR